MIPTTDSGEFLTPGRLVTGKVRSWCVFRQQGFGYTFDIRNSEFSRVHRCPLGL